MATFDPAWPHGDIAEIFPDIFMVRGTNKTQHKNINYQFSRNMVIVRHNGELSLINTVRLNEAGLKKLDQLGKVKNIIRIGAFHGRDDPFYIDHYKAAFWTIPGMQLKDEQQSVQTLSDENVPFPGCTVFTFNLPKFAEGILHINKEGGILITCDSIQNWKKPDEFFNWITKLVLRYQKVIGPAKISPIWQGACQPKKSDFEQLLQLDFKHLFSAHGDPIVDNAKEQVAASIERTFEEGR